MCESFAQTSGLIHLCPNQVFDQVWSRIIQAFLCLAESKRFRVTISARVWSLFPLDDIPTMTPVDRFDYCHPSVPHSFFFFFVGKHLWRQCNSNVAHRNRKVSSPHPILTTKRFFGMKCISILQEEFCSGVKGKKQNKKKKERKENKASGYVGGGVGFGAGPTLLNRDVWIDDRHWPFFPPAGPWRPGLPVQPRLCSA